MPKTCLKFISGFLIPSLNDERFGSRLMWLDKEKQIFQIDWHHKSMKNWNEREADVFVEWDKAKGHYQPELKEYFTKSKQRFRALLYKFSLQNKILKLKSDEKLKKIYKIAIGSGKTKSAPGEESDEEMSVNNLRKIMEIDNDIYRRKSFTNSPSALGLEDHDYVVPIDYLSDAKSEKENNITFTNESSFYPSDEYGNNFPINMDCQFQPIFGDPQLSQQSNDTEDTKMGLECPPIYNPVEVQNCFQMNKSVNYYHYNKTVSEKVNVITEDKELKTLLAYFDNPGINALPDNLLQNI